MSVLKRTTAIFVFLRKLSKTVNYYVLICQQSAVILNSHIIFLLCDSIQWDFQLSTLAIINIRNLLFIATDSESFLMENFYFDILYRTEICYPLASFIASRIKLERERKIQQFSLLILFFYLPTPCVYLIHVMGKNSWSGSKELILVMELFSY